MQVGDTRPPLFLAYTLWRLFRSFKVKILFYPLTMCATSTAKLLHPTVHRFANSLYKVFFFLRSYLHLRRTSALLCKKSPLRPTLPELSHTRTSRFRHC